MMLRTCLIKLTVKHCASKSSETTALPRTSLFPVISTV
ncbi:hypothetical protein Ahy_A06g026765 isoform B [Arachis hypogaea]|uniref:Uncharacterized protein n=1 Tax=Arachis hypogaea TaxID=3818 RepID=A0A445CLM8_ARAHY|nr:hypothetical protein Ahy_A06g026765 isoform B [Arachis hypogaea]